MDRDLIQSLKLPAALVHQARSLEHLGVSEQAWPRAAVLEVIDHLGGQPIAVLAGHVLVRRDQRLTHNYDNWHSDRNPYETFPEFASRSQREARAYVSRYPIVSPEPFFTLVLSAEAAT